MCFFLKYGVGKGKKMVHHSNRAFLLVCSCSPLWTLANLLEYLTGLSDLTCLYHFPFAFIKQLTNKMAFKNYKEMWNQLFNV